VILKEMDVKKLAKMRASRIDKIVSNLGYSNRKGAAAWVRKNGLTVDGIPIRDPTMIVYPQRLQMEGKPLPFLSPDLTIILHKPKEYVCSKSRDFSENKKYTIFFLKVFLEDCQNWELREDLTNGPLDWL